MERYVVIDASLAVMWAVPESHSEQALRLAELWGKEDTGLLAPCLLLTEAANALLLTMPVIIDHYSSNGKIGSVHSASGILILSPCRMLFSVAGYFCSRPFSFGMAVRSQGGLRRPGSISLRG